MGRTSRNGSLTSRIGKLGPVNELHAAPRGVRPDGVGHRERPSPYAELLSRIRILLNAGDLGSLIRLVPIRDTVLRNRVARALRFQPAADYEAAAGVRIREDATLAAKVRSLIGPMPS